MVNKDKSTERKNKSSKRPKLPPKGTAARALLAAGLWSHLTEEEIEHIRAEIYGSRRSSR